MSAAFEKIIIVMFENQYRSYVRQHAFMNKLAQAGASMNNFFGCFHPSQTNYLSSFAGEVCNVTNDTPPAQPLTQTNMVDLLEAQKVSWKAYMEAYPNEPWNPDWAGTYPDSEQPITEYPNNGTDLARYFRKHNAFASFKSVQQEQSRWEKIVSDHQFWSDVANKELPQYSWFTPDIWNDGHYLYNTHIDTQPRTQLIPQIATYLEHIFLGNIETSKLQGYDDCPESTIGLNLDIDLLITNPEAAWEQSNVPPGTLIVVTFDEADFNATNYDTNYDGPNQIYTVLLGDMIKPGTQIDTPYNHFSLIKTVQKNFGLASLEKNDEAANWLRSLWNEQWQWGAPQTTPLANVGQAIAATALGDDLLTVYSDSNGALYSAIQSQGQWGTATPLNITSSGPIAMSALGDTAYVIYNDAQQQLHSLTYEASTGWAQPEMLTIAKASAFTISQYTDLGDNNNEKLMLCWQPPEGTMQSKIFGEDGWGAAQSVGQYTDGAMALTQFGGSLFLVYKQRNTRRMNITSFNVAPFNVITAQTFDDKPAPDNDTTQYQWSPTEYLVGHFGGKESRQQNLYQASGQLALAVTEGQMHLIYRDAYEDTPQFYHTCFGLTGILTAASQLTNGYGTLNQAGWTEPQLLAGTTAGQGLPVCVASNGQSLTLLWQSSAQGEVSSRIAEYITS